MPKSAETEVNLNAELFLYRLDQIDKKLDEQNKNFVTKQEFKDATESLEKDIADLRRQKTIAGWVMPVVTAVVSSVFTALVIYALISRK